MPQTRTPDHHEPRRLGRDVVWLWAGYLGRSLGYLGLIVVFTRSLGASGFGTLSVFLAVVFGVSQVAGSWPFLAVPVLQARRGSIAAAFRPAFHVAAIATAASLLVALPVCLALGVDQPISLLAVVLSAVALVGLQGIFAVLQTEGRMRGIALLQAGERGIALPLALGAALTTGLAVVGAQLIVTFAAAVVCAVAYAVIGRRQRLFSRRYGEPPEHLVSTVMDAVGAMGLVSLCSYGVAYADIFVLAIFRSHTDVGIYSLAYQVFSFISVLSSYWLVVALPEHARSSAAGRELREQLPLPSLAWYTALWAALVGLAGIAAAFALPVVFGTGFEAATEPLLLLLGGSAVFGAVYFAMVPALVGGSRSGVVARAAVGSVVVNIVLDVALVPSLGVIAPALATFGQTIVGSVTLAIAVLGTRSALRLLAVATPVAATTMLLAVDPDDLVLVGLSLLAAAGTVLCALAVRRSRPAPIGPSSADPA